MTTPARIITSQDYLCEDTVEEKREAKNYTIILSPAFEYDGQVFQVLLDGHHRYEAALLDSVEPDITIAEMAGGWDILCHLENGSPEAFLAACNPAAEWRYADTKSAIW